MFIEIKCTAGMVAFNPEHIAAIQQEEDGHCRIWMVDGGSFTPTDFYGPVLKKLGHK